MVNFKGLATKHTTIKWPFTKKQAQKQTENKSLTQFLIYFNFLPVIDKTTLARLVSNAGTLGKALGTRFTHTTHTCFICLSPNNKLVTVPISIVTNQPMAQYHKYDVL